MALGRFEEARRTLAEGAELCRRWDRESLGWTHQLTCTLPLFGGDPAGADMVAHARQAVEIAETLGDAFSRVNAAGWLAIAQVLAGAPGEAEQSFERFFTLIAERGAGLLFEPGVRRARAEGLAAAGEPERAVAEGVLAVEQSDERGLRVFAPSARHSLARVLIERGGPGDAERASALLDEAEVLAREMGALPDLAANARARAELCELRGDREGRERALTEAVELARRIDARGLLAELEVEPSARAAIDA